MSKDLLTWKPVRIIGKDRTNLSSIIGEKRVLFVDTTGDDHLRVGTDLDLSHWYPNQTPTKYRADTSTEIALNFAAANPDHDFIVVNDHSDTDGLLGVFVLACPELALENRQTVTAAAEIGDFSFHGSREALLLYASLQERNFALQTAGVKGQLLFEDCLSFIADFLRRESAPSASVVAAVDAHERSVDLIERGQVHRSEVDTRLARYIIDAAAGEQYLALAAKEPRFDQPLSEEVWISHRARNFADKERLQLVSVRIEGGWKHELWLPQYVPWDTETLWRPAAWQYSGKLLTWLASDELALAVDAVASQDEEGSEWVVRDTVAPWSSDFPIIAKTATVSMLDPDTVAEAFVSLAV
jgi:hypothetical protein